MAGRLKPAGPAARGYLLLSVMIGVLILTVFLLMAVPLWETEIRREREEELVFRARQYVQAIEMYTRKHNNLSPQNFEILVLEKFLRKLYKDPMTAQGRWDAVLQSVGAKKLLIVPAEQTGRFLSRGILVGVCSTSPDSGFREYRGKKKYNEWAFYVGEKEDEEMPELEYAAGK
jgi:type II secretory pathway pseudopilin PulG